MNDSDSDNDISAARIKLTVIEVLTIAVVNGVYTFQSPVKVSDFLSVFWPVTSSFVYLY